jgi:hypothetical protein
MEPISNHDDGRAAKETVHRDASTPEDLTRQASGKSQSAGESKSRSERLLEKIEKQGAALKPRLVISI